MRIHNNNGKVEIYTPYNKEFVQKIKGIGEARWNGKCWIINEENLNVARKIMRDVYGYSDIEANETVSVEVITKEEVYEHTEDVVLLGKVLSHAIGRDSGGYPGEDVAYVKGKAESGGSRSNWISIVPENSKIILRNVNKNIYDKYMQNPDERYEIHLIENKVNKKQLQQEKERLLERIAEIDELLSKTE
jgi:hypothetical protein